MSARADSAPADPQRRLDPYIPRVLLRQLVTEPDVRLQTVDGTVVFADISGFTKLSERLARQGREGSEELTDTIGSSLSTLLAVAYENGGSLLKFGGDALLLLFEGEGHVVRAAHAAAGMRSTLRRIGRLETSAGRVTLRISQGVHSGTFHLFLAGGSHRELVLAGPAVSATVRMEKAAGAGDIVLSAAAAAALGEAALGAPKGEGRLLGVPPGLPPLPPAEPAPQPSLEQVAGCLSTMVRAHALAAHTHPEHRHVAIAFVRFEGIDALIDEEGADAAADAVDRLVRVAQRAADEHEVCFLGSDADDDGGKILLTAGAPRAIGEDEQRLLLAVRAIADADLRLPLRIGVNRGNVFAGDIGPAYRRTYTVMGDAVNLAARVMAKAPPGEIYATAGVLERSGTRFETTELEPFSVKGKSKPVPAWSLGRPIRGQGRADDRLPLVGRAQELAALEHALASARAGAGRLIEIVGEPGIGKSRLNEELLARATGIPSLRATGEAFTATTPYVLWRELLRQIIGVGWEDPDPVVLSRLTECIEQDAPELRPWLPLLALPLDVDPPMTPEVEALAPEFRRRRLHEVVIVFLRAMTRGPTLVTIDGGQHVDEASADLLGAVAREIETVPWLVVVMRREVEAGGFLAPQAIGVVQLTPGPLASAELRALADAATDAEPLPPHVLDLAVERSAGNPQFLRDLLRAAAAGDEELPDTIEAAAMARIDRLEPGDRMLIRRASILGLSFHPRFLAEVLDAEVAPPTAETWARLGAFLTADGDGYLRFRRGVVRDAAYEALPYRLRRTLHAAVGRRMEEDYAEMLDEVGGLLSLHFFRAGDHTRTWTYARSAARRAEERFAYAAAAGLHRRALEAARTLEVPPGELAEEWEALGEAYTRTGEVSRAVSAFRRARELLPEDRVRAAGLMHRNARVNERVGRTRSAVRWAHRGLRELEGVDGPEAAAERARLVTTLGSVRRQQGRTAEAARLFRDGLRDAELAGDDVLEARAGFMLDWALFELGRREEAVRSERALEIYERVGDLERQAVVLNNLGMFAYWEGRWTRASELYARAAETSERAGDAWAAAYGDCNIGELLADQGRYEQAELRLRRARRVWRGTQDDAGVAFTSALLGRLAAREGRGEEGIELIRLAIRDFRDLDAAGDAALSEAYLAEALLLMGRAVEALAEADRQLAQSDRAAVRPLLLRVRGAALAAAGEDEQALQALQASLAEARARDEPYEVLLALEALPAVDDAPDAGLAAERDALRASLDIVAPAGAL